VTVDGLEQIFFHFR